VARRQVDQLDTPIGKTRVEAHEDGIGAITRKSFEGLIDVAAAAGVKDLELQSHGAASRFQVSQCGLCRLGIGRIDEDRHPRRSRYERTQELQPFCAQLSIEEIDTCQVATWPSEAGDQTKPDRVFGDKEDHGDYRSCGLRGQRRHGASERSDHGNLPPDQFGRQRGQPIELIVSPAVFDRHVLALDVAGVLQALTKSAQTIGEPIRRCGVEKSDHRHRCLLRPCRDRPRRRRPAEQRDEVAALQ